MKPVRFWALGLAILLAGCQKPIPSVSPPARRQPQAEAKPAAVAPAQTFHKIREPAVAGQFYPRDKEALAKLVDHLLAQAQSADLKNLRALVCPHAGYEFSGHTAAAAYKQVAGRDVATVIILGPSHTADFEGAALPDADAFATPLGNVAIAGLAAELVKTPPFVLDPRCEVSVSWARLASTEGRPHTWEHSVEVQLPFLQQVAPQAAIVPIVLGRVDPAAVARELVKHLDDRTLLVASSDLSHYLPDDTARRMDEATVRAICALDADQVGHDQACGRTPIHVLIHLARQKHWKATLLELRNSGDVTHDNSGVVGYAAIAFTAGEGPQVEAKPAVSSSADRYSPQDRTFLLDLARTTIKQVVNHGSEPDPKAEDVAAHLTDPRGCFVTLKKEGELRGCIGSLVPCEPLYQAVIHMARAAATEDPRFSPVQPEELEQLVLEISVLSVPQPLDFNSPEDLLEKLRPGIDGVVLRVGHAEATFLPQVWEELSDKEQFLSHLARKAGLSSFAWQSPKAEVLTYRVEAFKETGN